MVFLKDPEFFLEKENNWFAKEAFRTGNLWLEAINWVMLSSFTLVLLKLPLKKIIKEICFQSTLFSFVGAVSTNVLYGLLKQELLGLIVFIIMSFLTLFPALQILSYIIKTLLYQFFPKKGVSED